MPAQTLTRHRADAHEALYPRLASLTRQIEAIAVRRPDAAVAGVLRNTAETLLYEAQDFLPVRKSLPAAAADMAGLATQLGQALAALDVYEAANSFWHADQQCRVWNLPAALPVRRLRPMTKKPIPTRKEQRIQSNIRQLLVDRIQARTKTAYDEGYRDAQSGRPQNPRYD